MSSIRKVSGSKCSANGFGSSPCLEISNIVAQHSCAFQQFGFVWFSLPSTQTGYATCCTFQPFCCRNPHTEESTVRPPRCNAYCKAEDLRPSSWVSSRNTERARYSWVVQPTRQTGKPLPSRRPSGRPSGHLAMWPSVISWVLQ